MDGKINKSAQYQPHGNGFVADDQDGLGILMKHVRYAVAIYLLKYQLV